MLQVRVLQIITQMVVGGASEHVAYLMTHFPKDKYEIHLLSGTPVEKARMYVNSVTPSSNITYWQIPELVVPANPVKDFIALWKIYRFLKKNKYQVIHTNSSKAGIIGRLAAGYAKAPIVLHTVHGWSFNDRMSPLRKKMYVAMERWSGRYTDSLIVVTKFDIQKGLQEGIGTSEKYTVIHPGVELKRFEDLRVDLKEKKKSLGVEPGMDIVCMIGRLSEQKAPDDFVRVAAKVVKKHPQTAFLLIGEGPLYSKIQSMIKELKLEKNVILTGYYPGNIFEIIPVIDIFMLTSLWEGLPKVFPMSMAAGKPIVATKIDGALEVIEDGVTGYLVEPRNVDLLAEKVLFLLENKEKAKEMGEQGRKKVAPDYSLQNMVEKTDRLYQSLLSTLGAQ